MAVVRPRCAGLDVHTKSVVACALVGEAAAVVVPEVATFGTMTVDLERLAGWLAARGITAVVMEATGASWQPIDTVLERHGGFRLVVGTAEPLQAVPGRKTDGKDAVWLARLLRHGLVRPRFIPEREQRERRELTRDRTALLRDRASEVNRRQKPLEAATSKLAAVISDVTGVAGPAILDAPVHGEEDPARLADLAHWRVQQQRAAPEPALVGQLSPTLTFVVKPHLRPLRELDALIAACDAEVEPRMRPFAAAIRRRDELPGVGPRTAQVIVAELGGDMPRFPSHRPAAAWAGLCPGNDASGGNRRRAQTRKGSPWLRCALAAAAWAARRCQGGYRPEPSRRRMARRGKQRAIVAGGHTILVIAYHLLARGTTYHDLGPEHFDRRDADRVRRRALHQLAALGYDVSLTPKQEVA